MSLDVSALLSSVAQSATDAVGEMADDIGGDLVGAIKGQTSIVELLEAKASGEITEEEFDMEMEREKKVLEAEMLTLQIYQKVAVQAAMNAAMNVLKTAIKPI